MNINWGEVIKNVAPAGIAAGAGMLNARAANQTERQAIERQTAQDAQRAEIDRAELALKREQDARAAQADAMRKALQSALIMNTGDASFSREGFRSPVANISFSGGSRPSALGAEGRQAAELLNNQALQSLMSEGKPKTEAVPKAGGAGGGGAMPQPDKSSVWEKALGMSTLGATLGPSIWGAMKGGGSFVDDAVKGTASKALEGGRSVMGGLNSIAGPAAMGAGLISNFMPEGAAKGAMSGASTGATLGSLVPGVGTAIGAGIGALVGGIKSHQNDTLGAREEFAKKLGYGNGKELEPLFQKLREAGRQDLVDIAIGKIGRHDKAGNQAWMQEVASVVPPAPGRRA